MATGKEYTQTADFYSLGRILVAMMENTVGKEMKNVPFIAALVEREPAKRAEPTKASGRVTFEMIEVIFLLWFKWWSLVNF